MLKFCDPFGWCSLLLKRDETDREEERLSGAQKNDVLGEFFIYVKCTNDVNVK